MDIFNFFKRKQEIQESQENNIESPKAQARETLEAAKASLNNVQIKMFEVKNQDIFVDLLAFVGYYSAIIQYYNSDLEAIISVNELLLFKYIDMIADILVGFDEKYATMEQAEELSNTLHTINEKLFGTLQNIREQQSLDLNIDLKTIRDLIKLDF